LRERNADFVEQLEANIAAQEKLGRKKYTLGGSPFVNSNEQRKKGYVHKSPLGVSASLQHITFVPPRTSYSMQAMSRVLSADLTPYDVHLLLLYLRDHYPPPEVFIVTDELKMGVEQ